MHSAQLRLKTIYGIEDMHIHAQSMQCTSLWHDMPQAQHIAQGCLSLCNVDGLCSHNATKNENRNITAALCQARSVSWLPACRSQPRCTVILNSTEEDQFGMENTEFCTYNNNNLCIHWLTCCTISASDEILIDITICRQEITSTYAVTQMHG